MAWLGRPDYPVLVYTGATLFAGVLITACRRYWHHGPERTQVLPSVSISADKFALVNIQLDNAMLDGPVLDRLTEIAVQYRRPLPFPTGSIVGSASDADSIRLNPAPGPAAIGPGDPPPT